jgi:hypothetical protein
MITAKNYVAQASRYLESLLDTLIKLELPGDGFRVNHIIGDMKKAVHFAIPDGGFILNTKDFLTLEGIPFRMPYPAITIEFASPESAVAKHVLLAVEIPKDNILVQSVIGDAGGEYEIATVIISMVLLAGGIRDWDLLPTAILMTDRPKISADGKLIEYFPFRLLPKLMDAMPNKATIEQYVDMNKSHITPLCEFIAALSCTNVGTETHQEAYRDNTKRIAKGKLPIYETKVLTLNVTSAKKGGKGGGGSSTPKRQHFRRGHIFKCHGKNTWRNACLVGKNRDGFIDKDYRLT